MIEDAADTGTAAAAAPDDYGGLKLKCEAHLATAAAQVLPPPEPRPLRALLRAALCMLARGAKVLKPQWGAQGFPFTTLRPPSVIGPACDSRHERLQVRPLQWKRLPVDSTCSCRSLCLCSCISESTFTVMVAAEDCDGSAAGAAGQLHFLEGRKGGEHTASVFALSLLSSRAL